jgi:hypothetical protein
MLLVQESLGGRPVGKIPSPESPAPPSPNLLACTPANASSLYNSELLMDRETYVCFPVTRAEDRGTPSEKKGPLQHVNPIRSGEEKQGCRNPGNGQVLDPAKTPTSRSHGQAYILRRTYFSRTARQTSTEHPESKGMACVYRRLMLPNECAEQVYNLYPRHVGKRIAIRAIENAITRLRAGEYNQKPMALEDVYKFIITKTRQYRDSPAGNRESLTPHPSTFFNQSRYLDDEVEWHRLTASEVQAVDEKMRMHAHEGLASPFSFRPQ